ncbi:4879_t:CDS:2, partial [Racocetra persica]
METYELPKNLQEQLKNALNDVEKSPEILERQEIREYFQEYRQKIDDQLIYFNDFDEKALKIDDLNQIINLEFEILFSFATLKTGIFLLVKKLKNIDLENTCPNEINLTFGKIDKYLPEWINCCTKITNKFKDINDFISKIEDSHFFFAIQEEILTKVNKTKTNLHHMSEKIDKNKKKFFPKNIKEVQDEIYLNFFQIIGLKLVYDLATKLEYTTKFWEKFLDELRLNEKLLKNFEQSELYVKEYCLDYVVENLTEIGCSVNNFCKQIIDERN